MTYFRDDAAAHRFRRFIKRYWLLAAVLSAVAVILGIPLAIATGGPQPGTPEKAFIDSIRGTNGFLVDDSSDQSLITSAKDVCASLDSGASVKSIVAHYATIQGEFGLRAFRILEAGVPAFCPKYSDALAEELD